MKTRRKQSGLILLYVILLLALVGPSTWLLFDTALQSARRTRLQRVQSDAESLLCSARAWAAENRSRLGSAPEGTVFDLDPNSLGVVNATCRLTVLPRETDEPRVQIETRSAIGHLGWTEQTVITLLPEQENRDQAFPDGD